jgi:hypothetical protein
MIPLAQTWAIVEAICDSLSPICDYICSQSLSWVLAIIR